MSRPPKSKVSIEFPKRISIKLTGAEGIVLHSFLARFNQDEKYRFEDQSEQRVLWDIECTLEKELSAPLTENYAEFLAKARAEVRDPKD